MEEYSARKRNELLVQATAWTSMENVMLSERNQTQMVILSIYMKCPEQAT